MADNSPEAGYKQQVAEFFSQLKEIVDESEVEMEKFAIKDNSAAGLRLRKNMQAAKGLAQEIREAVQNAKNAAK